MQFKPMAPGIEVRGVASILEGFKRYPTVALKYLIKFGVVPKTMTKLEQFDALGWYSQEAWLAAIEAMSEEVGFSSLYAIGKQIPERTVFPPSITDIHAAIKSIDIAYHMNHRRDGKLMFDPETGVMLEGIGHYGYAHEPGTRKIVSVCENPYPCDFDRGIVTAMAARFEPYSKVTHDQTKPCRKNGGSSCTLVITW